MPSELIKKLLESGVHFGHKTSRWNPKMKKFIFSSRSGIYIIDLEKTEECLHKAKDFVIDITSRGELILFVGTKKQAQEVIQREASRCGMYYVSERWPGGLLTNFFTVKKSIARLKQIEKMKETGIFENLTKKEVALLEKELVKLKKSFSGIVQMERMPGAMFVVDTKKEETAVKEALRLSIPIIGLIDTNSNPDYITYPIPGNDDATKSIQMVTAFIADCAIEGRKRFLSYLSQGSAALKEKGQKQEELLPEEIAQIKAFEELIEDKEGLQREEQKPVKKGRSAPTHKKE